MPTLKKLIIFSVSLIACFFIGIIIDLACGPEADPYDYYASFFHNTILGNDNYKPFYFNGYQFLNSDEEPANQAEINSAEWAVFLGADVKATDVNKAMYKLESKVDSALLLKYLKPNGKLPDSLYKNTFLKALVSGERNRALYYYRFVKGIEPLVSVPVNAWNPKSADPQLQIAKASEAVKRANAERISFLKLRYYYQAQRLYHYAGEISKANHVYETYIAGSKSKSSIIGLALALKAGEEWSLKNSAKAAYLFSKVFALYPDRRIQAYINFNNINERSRNILKFAKSNNEKAFVYAIIGFHTQSVSTTALEQVYKYQPRSPLIQVFLIREINKLEENYLSVKLDKNAIHDPYSFINTVGQDSIARKQKVYIKTLKVFCNKLVTQGRYPEPALGNLAYAYLSWMTDDNSAGFKALDKTNGDKLNPRLYDQKQLIRLLLISQKIKSFNSVSENELLPSLTWLNKKIKVERQYKASVWSDNKSLKSYSASARDFYALVLAPAYLKQKDTAMAALAMLKSQQSYTLSYNYDKPWPPGFNMPDFLQRIPHSHDLLKVINWCHHSRTTYYLKAVTAGVTDSIKYDLYDLLGTAYLREHKYNSAVNAFKHIPLKKRKLVPSDWWGDITLYSNPFLDRLHDYPKVFSSNPSRAFNKLQFAIKMAQLQKLAHNNPKKAAGYYYTMANGLYSTSYNGNSWYYISYTWNSYDADRKRTEYYDGDFLNASNAEKYYLKARSLSKNAEFKARCTFMAAKCKQQQFIGDWKYRVGADGEYNRNVRNNPYFVNLRKDYARTAFYKTAVNECSYFRDFIAGKKK